MLKLLAAITCFCGTYMLLTYFVTSTKLSLFSILGFPITLATVLAALCSWAVTNAMGKS